MITIIFGIAALVLGKLRISKYYGLEGTGARVAGMVILLFGLIVPRLLTKPLIILFDKFGLGPASVLIAAIVIQAAAIWMVIWMLVNHYGNAYGKD